MKNKNRFSAVLIGTIMVAALAGCGSSEETEKGMGLDPVKMSEASPAAEKTEQSEKPKGSEDIQKSEESGSEESGKEEQGVEEEITEGDATSYYVEQYREVLDNYYYALYEQWGAEDLMGEGLSILNTYCNQEDNALDNVGFAFMDMDGDGEYELLLGAIAGDEFVDKAVFEMYTLENGVPIQIFCGQERDMYYVCSEEAGGYYIVNSASAGAGLSGWCHYYLMGTDFMVAQAILTESDGDTTKWYMAYDEDWDTSNDSLIEEELGTAVIDSMKWNIMLPEYIAFSLYNPSR